MLQYDQDSMVLWVAYKKDTVVETKIFFRILVMAKRNDTKGGPPRKIVPCFFTMMDSSAMAGTYAPPAVQLPITTAT